jgi:hypothetical protein
MPKEITRLNRPWPYAKNQYKWPVGSLVLHRDVAKRVPFMMMKVIGYVGDLAVTKYVVPSVAHNFDKPMRNGIEHLLDPATFGYFVPVNYLRHELLETLIFMKRWRLSLPKGDALRFHLVALEGALREYVEFGEEDTTFQYMAESALNALEHYDIGDWFSQGSINGYEYLLDAWTEDRLIREGQRYRW